jgi:hypothetical protein
MRDSLEPASRVETRSDLVGERFILHETVLSSRADGLVVKTHGVKIAVFDSRRFTLHQHGAALEILRAAMRPAVELALVFG